MAGRKGVTFCPHLGQVNKDTREEEEVWGGRRRKIQVEISRRLWTQCSGLKLRGAPGLESEPAQGLVPWEESGVECGERRGLEQNGEAPAFRGGAAEGKRDQDSRQPEVTQRDHS